MGCDLTVFPCVRDLRSCDDSIVIDSNKVIFNIIFSKDQIQLINCSNKNIIISQAMQLRILQRNSLILDA